MKYPDYYKPDKKKESFVGSIINDVIYSISGTDYTHAMGNAFKVYKIKVGPKTKILEAGCGHGKFTIYWGQFGCRCVGVDVDIEKIHYCNRMDSIFYSVREYINPAVFELGDIRDLSKYHKYDVVFNEGVLEHFPQKVQHQILQEMVKASKNIVLVFVPDGDDKKAVDFAKTAKHYDYDGKGGMGLTEKPIKKGKLQNMLKDVGLKNINIWKVNEYLMGAGQK